MKTPRIPSAIFIVIYHLRLIIIYHQLLFSFIKKNIKCYFLSIINCIKKNAFVNKKNHTYFLQNKIKQMFFINTITVYIMNNFVKQ